MRATASLAVRPATRPAQPVVVGHRGAPAYRPEHTAASYQLAIDLGAELIEPDVVISRDGVLVVRHENELSLSTDVAARAEFAGRRTTKEVDGAERTGWFAEDFTLAELRTLRAVERMPDLRPLNTAYDGHFGILTLGEVVSLARTRSTDERPIRVLAELKHAEWTTRQGLPMAELLAAELRRLDATDASGPVVVQSFESTVLRDVRTLLGEEGPQMIQLVHDDDSGDRMVGRAGLREISTYAQGIGPSRERVLGYQRSGPGRTRRRGAPRGPGGVLLDPAGGERVPARAPAGRRCPQRPGRRTGRGAPAARARRRRPDHRLTRPRRPRDRRAVDRRLRSQTRTIMAR